MKRLAFFLTISLFLIMAALPFRSKAFADYGHSHAAVEEEFYYTLLDQLSRLKNEGAGENEIHRCMLKVAKSQVVLKQYRTADQMFRSVWQARSNAKSSYDEIYVASVVGLAGLRRDTGNLAGAISCYSIALAYDMRHLSPRDVRLTRDKTNLAIANLLAAKSTDPESGRLLYLRKAAGLLVEAIDEEKRRMPAGSLREANARQDLAYVLKCLNDKRGYELEMQKARIMQRKLASGRACFEP